jgi:hypothetical protein
LARQWNNEEKVSSSSLRPALSRGVKNSMQRVARGVPGPGKLRVRVEDGAIRLWLGSGIDDLSKLRAGLAFVANQKRGKLGRTCHRRREADRFQVGRQRAQAREIERQEIAHWSRPSRAARRLMTVRSARHRDATA